MSFFVKTDNGVVKTKGITVQSKNISEEEHPLKGLGLKTSERRRHIYKRYWGMKGTIVMGEKSLQKRKYILETARKVFMEKGYKRVTMKDIVDACGISRGGLYLYFESTSQIFMEVLKLESQETDDVFADSIKEDATAADILVMFLNEQKKELLRGEDTLTQATYEFYFEEEIPKKNNLLKKQFDSAVKIIEKLIEIGVENGEFYCEDCKGKARNIMYVLEGLKICAQTIGITEEAVDREIVYILKGLDGEA